ncbi:unnamed protein product [Citrullus colocynthis]|uniref:Uncharacterized protein n=1 Tax=Citrullus colocynthis TaxID=252529 RepID=A0ABP0Y996_9ROSI
MEPSSSPTFLSNSNPPLSSSESEFSDIEMTPLQSYTSLKDLLPDSPSPPPSAVAAPLHCPAWDELPIKNPLVKHAALAYLQPMLRPPVAGDRTFMRRLKKHGFGCIEWLAAVVAGVRRW